MSDQAAAQAPSPPASGQARAHAQAEPATGVEHGTEHGAEHVSGQATEEVARPERAGRTIAQRSERPQRGSTVRSLRAIAVAGLIAGTATGAASYVATTSDAGAQSAVHTAQVQRLETARTTIASLPGVAASPTEFTSALTTVSGALTDASAARPNDAAAIAAVNADYVRYAVTLGATGAAGAEGTQGAEREALATRLDSSLSELANAERAAANAADTRAGRVQLLVVGTAALAIATLVGGSVWLARLTRRVVNPGLVTGAVLVGGVAWTTWQDAVGTWQVPGAAVLLGGIAAGVAAWVGVDRRRREYRA